MERVVEAVGENARGAEANMSRQSAGLCIIQVDSSILETVDEVRPRV